MLFEPFSSRAKHELLCCVATYHCWSSQINLQVIKPSFPLIRPNEWKFSPSSWDQISRIPRRPPLTFWLTTTSARWKWKRPFDYISRRGECPLPSSLCPLLTFTLDQTSHALSLIDSPHWIRDIGAGSISKQFPNFCSGLLKYSKCASTFQSGLGKVSIDVPSSRSNPLLSCDTLNLI